MKKLVCVVTLIAVVLSGCNAGDRGRSSDPRPTATATRSARTGTTTASLADGAPTVFTSWSPPSARMTDTVDADGFQVDLERVSVTAPNGVAALDSSVTVSTPTEPTPSGANGFSNLVGNPVRVTLGNGEQPRQPVTIVLDLAGTDLAANVSAESPLGVVAQSEDSGAIELLPSKWDGEAQTLTVVTPHLSWFWPFRFDLSKLYQPIIDTLQTTVGLRYPAPACFGKSLTVGGATYSVGSVPNQVVWPCLTQRAGQMTLELHSNSALPWRARTDPGAPGTVSGISDISGMALAEAYNQLFAHYADIESVVVPGASTSFQFDPAHPPRSASVKTDVGLYLVAALLFGVELAFDVFGVDTGPLKDVHTMTCLMGIVETATSTDILGGLQRFITTALDCFQVAVERVKAPSAWLASGSILVSLFTTGVGLAAAGFQGAVASAVGEFAFSIVRHGSASGAMPTRAPTIRAAPVYGDGWIAYTGEDGNIWLVRPDGSDRRQITTEGTRDRRFGSANWSPDGTMLTFTGPAESSSGIYVYRAGRLSLVPDTTGCGAPAITGNGRLLYSCAEFNGRNRPEPSQQDLENDPRLAAVTSSNLDGSDTRVLVPYALYESGADGIPWVDSQAVGFNELVGLSVRGGSGEILATFGYLHSASAYVISADGGTISPIPYTDYEVRTLGPFMAMFQPGGEGIVATICETGCFPSYKDQVRSISILDRDGSVRQRLIGSETAPGLDGFTLSPDGSTLIFTTMSQSGGVPPMWEMPLNGSVRPLGAGMAPAWQPVAAEIVLPHT